jgi:hypothetical protein
MARRRGKRTVTRLVTDPRAERLTLGGPHELDGLVGHDIGVVALQVRPFAVDVLARILVLALRDLRGPVIVAGLHAIVLVHMKFSDVRGAPAVRLQHSRQRLQFLVPPNLIADDAVLVRIQAGEEAGTAGCAQRHRHESIGEQNSFAPDAIDVGSLEKRSGWWCGNSDRR